MFKNIANDKCKGGIIRCKDRFNPENMAFGYRDLLINVNCPGSEKKIPIVCEIQLHHRIFYENKKISHSMYKKGMNICLLWFVCYIIIGNVYSEII